jgi:hypothetical protein
MHCPCRLQPRDPKKDAAVLEAKNLMRRKRIQLEHAREYDDAVVALKQKVRQLAVLRRRVGRRAPVSAGLGRARGHTSSISRNPDCPSPCPGAGHSTGTSITLPGWACALPCPLVAFRTLGC